MTVTWSMPSKYVTKFGGRELGDLCLLFACLYVVAWLIGHFTLATLNILNTYCLLLLAKNDTLHMPVC